jgi:type IV secretion system protein VirB6
MIACSAPPTGSGFLEATLAHLDCQAQNIGEAGYQALASPSSPISLIVAVLLAIFVAIIGLRFLAGRPLGVDEWIASVLKIGFVMAFAASWPAYRTVVYDVVLKGPAEVSSAIGRASGLPGGDGGLAQRLQGVDNGIMALVVAGSGRLDVSAQTPEGTVAPPLADVTALGWAKTVFVTSIIASFGLLRLAGGFFLAIAPLFAGFLLFEGTRFLFLGWLRSLIAIAISSMGLAIILGVQLAVIEPWLTQVLALRAARVATLSAPFELLALTLSFSLAILGVFALAVRIGFASSILTKVQALVERSVSVMKNETATSRSDLSINSQSLVEQSRAQMVANAVRQTLNRETNNNASSIGSFTPDRTSMMVNARVSNEIKQHVPLGRSYPSPSRRISGETLNRKLAS